MRYLVILLVTFFLRCVTVSAQVIYSEHDGAQFTFNMVTLNSSSYYLINKFPHASCCDDEIYLVGRSANGTEKFRKHFFSQTEVLSAKVASDGSFLYAYAGSNVRECDLEGTNYWRLCKFDTTGKIWLTTVFNKPIVDVLPGKSGDFTVLFPDSAWYFNQLGIVAAKTNRFTFHSCLRLKSGNILYSYFSGGFRFKITSISGVQLFDTAATVLPGSLQEADNGEIYGVSNGHLYRFTPGLTLAATSSTLSVPASSISMYSLSNDSIAAISHLQGGVPRYLTMDNNFNLVHASTSNLEGLVITGLGRMKNGSAHLCGYNIRKPKIAEGSLYALLSPDDKVQSPYDLGIDNVSVTYDDVYYNAGWWAKASADVTVRNYGIDTIRSFSLSRQDYKYGIGKCLYGLNKKFDITIAPGAVATVNTDTFITVYYAGSPPPTPGYPLCILVSAPNSGYDHNQSNDELCKTVPLGLSGTYGNSELSVYPNPSDIDIKVQAHDLRYITVHDLAGRLVYREECVDGEIVISKESVGKGLFLLTIGTESSIRHSKIVFQ